MFPIHLDLGFRQFYYYEGLYFLIAIVLAYLWARARIKKYGLAQEQFSRGLIGVFIGAILGARLFHFIFWQPTVLFSDPLVFFRFWEGGISITGGLAGGILGGAIPFLGRKENFLEYFAVVAPSILLGQAIGRIGCFLNGDAWGTPTNLPWGMQFPKFGTFVPSFTPDDKIPGFAWSWARSQNLVGDSDLVTPALHPTQLYECLGDLALLGILLWAFTRWGQKKGGFSILMLHVGGYSLLRCLLEFMHGDRDVTVWQGMTSLQIVLALIVIVCTILLSVHRVRAAKAHKV